VPVDKDGDLCDSCEVSLLALSFSPKAVWKGVSLTLDYWQKGGVDKIRECDEKIALRDALRKLEKPNKKQQEKLEELMREDIYGSRKTAAANALKLLSSHPFYAGYIKPTVDKKLVEKEVKKLHWWH
jgi:hypothetical protein